MRLKRKVVKVADLEVGSEQTLLDVEKLNFLKQNFARIFESPQAYFGVEGNLVFRVKKRSFGPKILKAHSLSYEPTCTVIQTSFEGLAELADKYSCEIFELPDSFVICYPGILWLAKKEGVKEA